MLYFGGWTSIYQIYFGLHQATHFGVSLVSPTLHIRIVQHMAGNTLYQQHLESTLALFAATLGNWVIIWEY